MLTIRNPVEWGVDQLKHAAVAVEAAGRAGRRVRANLHSPAPAVARIGAADLWAALAAGFRDFAAFRTDVVFLCVLYPVAGLILARLAFGYHMLPLLFPLASGFALVGPFAAVGLYQMSRRREAGEETGWVDAFGVVRSPSFPAIVLLGLVLMAIFLLWLLAALKIYALTLGPTSPASPAAFIRDVFTTHAGWILIGAGVGVGFLFAVLVLTISVVSFPLLLDRESRPRHGGADLGARGDGQSGPDGAVGIDRRRRVGARLAAVSARSDHRHAGARSCDLAPLSAGGAALTRATPSAAGSTAPA